MGGNVLPLFAHHVRSGVWSTAVLRSLDVVLVSLSRNNQQDATL